MRKIISNISILFLSLFVISFLIFLGAKNNPELFTEQYLN